MIISGCKKSVFFMRKERKITVRIRVRLLMLGSGSAVAVV